MSEKIISIKEEYNKKIKDKILFSQKAGEEYQSALNQFALKIENGKKITEKDADILINAMAKTSKASNDIDTILTQNKEIITFIP